MKLTSTFALLALPFGILARELTQTGAPWGLRAISHREPHKRPWQTSLRRFEYFYDEAAGEGTFAYVIDGGVRISHKELEGRAENLWTADLSPHPRYEPNYDDKTGHGTHIAGTIASKTYGVAKKAHIVAVKVQNRFGKTTSSNLLSGIHKAVKDIIDKGRVGKAVINISLGGGCQERAVSNAISRAVSNGITIVQASGNEGEDAKDFCLAPKAGAITVGNMKPDWTAHTTSNFGSTVDIFGPGTDILSLSSADDKKVQLMSGTSMAAPHVAGVVLSFMSGSPKRRHEIVSLLDSTCTQGKMQGDLRGSPNKLVNNNNKKQKK
ncbi:Peptidase S8, subtilisin-related protein [Beauveria brongniartii RCEF 3172]|uniref:Peptidase S8, subtilisin-related protein n=1 Tax=Beauveria brongniartii RCEF 3172 TaxID=1081107 RepID=A0A167EKT7_9HYPO|nr:Peptidase S8, subtilisin-related protein [Beauveria brongniartii RCEF 3172]